MTFTESRGLKSGHWQANEEVDSNDMTYEAEQSLYENITDILSSLAGRKAIGGSYPPDTIVSGMYVDAAASGLAVNLRTGSAVSSSGSYYDTNHNWGFQAASGSFFAVVVPQDTSVTFQPADPTNPRIDIVEIQPLQNPWDSQARNFKDSVVGVVTSLVVDTKQEFRYQVQVKKGTAAGSPVAPTHDAGWIKLAEVTIPATATSLTQSNILGAGQSSNWTNEASVTVRWDEKVWKSFNVYEPGDPVFYGGQIYFCLLRSSGNIPSSSPTYWQQFNLATGSSFLNVTPQYIANPGFDSDTGGWNLYQNTAQTTPVNGTGGTVTNLSFARNTTSPMFGAGDAILSKAAFNDQGEGVSYDFTIDPGIVGQPLKVRFYYNTSANYVAGDVGVFMYDKTNSILIPLSVSAVPQSTGVPTQFLATFFPSTSTSYRLIFHIASTNALAWTMEIDNVEVSPYFAVTGDAMSGWNNFPLVITASGGGSPALGSSSTANICRWRRDGSDMDVEIHWVGTTTGSNAGTSGTYVYGLPLGFTIDSSKYWSTSASASHSVGIALVNGANPPMISGQAVINPTFSMSGVVIDLQNSSSGNLITTIVNHGVSYIPLTQVIELHLVFRVAIAQWTPNTNLATDFTEYASNSSSTDADDTTSFVYGSGGSAGIIGVTATSSQRKKRIQFQKAIQVTDDIRVEIWDGNIWLPMEKQGVLLTGSGNYCIQSLNPGSTTPSNTTNAGIGFVSVSGQPTQLDVVFGHYPAAAGNGIISGLVWSAITVGTKWRVRKVSNGNMAEQLPVVRAEFYQSAAQTISSSLTVVNFDTKVEDTNNAVTTGASWKFTAPVAGVYLVSTYVSWASGNTSQMQMYKNGASFFYQPGFGGAGAAASLWGTVSIRLNVGDYIQVLIASQSSIATVAGTGTHVTITRLGL